MATIRGTQIRDETIESIDLASGSIRAGEADEELIAGQPTLGSADASNDRLLIWDADGSTSGALKQVAPANLGVTASPAGSDTQVQFNDGGSTGADAGLIFDKSSGVLTVAKGAVFNEGSNDSDFRVESNNSTHMLFVDASSNRIGVGTSGPQHTIDIQERTGVEAVIRLQGSADVGIRLAADSDNSGENDNPYIDWYQDGQNSNSRNNRLASFAMEGDAEATFTDSIANAIFIDAFCPNAANSSLRPVQIANDSSKNGHKARITIEGVRGNVGLHTSTPGEALHLSGALRIDSQGRENLLTVSGTTGDDSHQMLVMSTTTAGYGNDTNVFISGTIGSKGGTVKGTSVLGGDAKISGSLSIGDSSVTAPTSRALDVYASVSGDYVAHIDNDASSAGHVLKLATDGNGSGTRILEMEDGDGDVVFRARADGRFGFGPDGVSSMGAGTFVVGIDNSSHTADIAISQRLQHLGDSNTYMDFPSNDNITFSAGGSEELKIASDAISIKEYIKHDGDDNTYIRFQDDDINLQAGGRSMIKISEGTIDQVLIMSGGAGSSPNVKSATDTNFFVSGTIGSRGTSTAGTSVFGGDVVISGTLNPTTLEIAGTEVTSTAAELNLLDASVTSEASDGVWSVVERVAKITVDSNDYARTAGPTSLGVTIPDNAILTKYVFDCTQTFAAGDDGTEAMAVVDLGLYNASGKVFDFASQANIERTGASSAPYTAAVSQVFPLAAASTKLTEALTAKIHVFDDGSGMLNSLDAGALDIYVYYIVGA